MSNRTEAQDYKIASNCELDAETRVNLLQHLDEHGPVSLLTSNKFSQYAGCFPEEITSAIAAQSALKASALTASAAMRARLQTRRRMTSYRQGRV